MSEEEEIEEGVEEEEEEEKPKQEQPSFRGSAISQINQQLDDFSYSLSLSFPSFGVPGSQLPQFPSSGRSGERGAGINKGVDPYSSHGDPPRDLMTIKEPVGKLENELYIPDKMSAEGSHRKGSRLSEERFRDFGVQTSDSVFANKYDSFVRTKKREDNRAGHSGDNPSFKHSGQRMTTEDSGPMKLFSKNVQDLYKRKPKQVYGEDEFRISGQTQISRFQ